MDRSTTDIDRKLAIYYHPLFQETMNLLSGLFMDATKRESASQQSQLGSPSLQLGMIDFLEFNLKLQKCLLPSFEVENAIISALNDWVKEVAECLSYEGMVQTGNCQEITDSNFEVLLRKEIAASEVPPLESAEKYVRTLGKLKSHDAFKLLGIRVNKEVFCKFMFDLCSTWCEFLDIEMFAYFLLSIFLQMSEGPTLSQSAFKPTLSIEPIEIEFMELFENLKQSYSKSRKKELRYYRAWCEWNYLRVGDVGEGLILSLDSILDDRRVLEIAHVFEKSIRVINEEITSQSHFPTPKQTVPVDEADTKGFLILKKLDPIKKGEDRDLSESLPAKNSTSGANQGQESEETAQNLSLFENQQLQQTQAEGSRQIEEQFAVEDEEGFLDESGGHQDFEIQIDELGNMYLKRVVKLPVLGQKVVMAEFRTKQELRHKWLEAKKQSCREVSNLYKRLENMKVRLEHNAKHDPYFYKKNPRLAQRDEFYLRKPEPEKVRKQEVAKVPVLEKSIHEKHKPAESEQGEELRQPAKEWQRVPHTKARKEPIMKNEEYIHKVIAPSFLTDDRNNVSYLDKKESTIYGTGAQDERRDIKFNLPKIKYLPEHKVRSAQSYHIVGRLVKSRSIINDKVEATLQEGSELTQKQRNPLGIPTEVQRMQSLKAENEHLVQKYLSEEEVAQLTNYRDLYSKIEKAKKSFGREFESVYRMNLRPILAYENRRHEMGGEIKREQEEKFYEKMKKLVNRDERRKKRREKKAKFRSYKKKFKGKEDRMLYEDIFINYHKKEIQSIKGERSRIKSLMESSNFGPN